MYTYIYIYIYIHTHVCYDLYLRAALPLHALEELPASPRPQEPHGGAVVLQTRMRILVDYFYCYYYYCYDYYYYYYY